MPVHKNGIIASSCIVRTVGGRTASSEMNPRAVFRQLGPNNAPSATWQVVCSVCAQFDAGDGLTQFGLGNQALEHFFSDLMTASLSRGLRDES